MSVYHVIYNPYSGNGKGRESAEKVKKLLPDDELEFLDITEVSKDYAGFFASVPEDDKVLLVGGDGTLNRFANETKDIELPDIYFYPSGTGNDFMRDVADGEDKMIVVNKYIKDLPTVTVNGNTSMFINGVGYGIDGYCCEIGDKMRAEGKTDINYAGIAIKGLLFHYKPTNAKITVDGKEYNFKKVWLAPTMNGRFYGGGMMNAPEQDRLSEEKTQSVVLMYGSGKIRTLVVFPSIFKGEHVKHKKMVQVITGKDITVEFDRPTALQIDGETVLGVTKYSVKSAKTEK